MTNNNNNNTSSTSSSPSSSPKLNSPNLNDKSTQTPRPQTSRVITVREAESETQPTASVEQNPDDENETTSIHEYSNDVVSIMKPVSLTMIIVILVVRHIQIQNSSSITQVYTENPNDSTSQKIEGSIIDALVVLGAIIFATLVVVFFYKMRWMKLLYGWLMLSTLVLLAFFGGYTVFLILQATNRSLDWITFAIIMWNFSVVGMLSVFWMSPPRINQFYLIAISCFMAIMLTRLPQWTTFALLAVIAIYDLFAVLCPVGPLIWLVETSRKRNEPLPALIYTTSAFILMATDEPLQKIVVIEKDQNRIESSLDEKKSIDQNKCKDTKKNIHESSEEYQLDLLIKRTQERKRVEEKDSTDNLIQPTEENPTKSNNTLEIQPVEPIQTTEDQNSENSGIKLGLGDFVFYSVLIGQAALQSDITVVFTTFIAIITGLFLTLLLLAIFKRALPALPISIALGILFYYLTNILLIPFVFQLGENQLFV